MAFPTQQEFHDAIDLLARDMGLQRLRDKLVRLNALVSRRSVSSAATLADQLYLLTSGLRKQVPATFAFHGIWGEHVQGKLGKDGEEQLEELAKAVNECLDEKDEISPDKTEAIAGALAAYAQLLASKVGNEFAYLDMLLKAVPQIAERLRANGLPAAEALAPAAPTNTTE